MLSWLVWLPWVVLVVIVIALFRWKQATHVVADPANARGKWVCVTGAAQGIGRATASELLRLGANVYAADINAAGLDEAFAGFGEDRVVKLRVDVTKQADVDELARRCAKHGVYAVVNSAGVASPPGQKRTVLLGAAELDVDADMLPVFNINVFGTARVNSALFPMIFEANGTIVNIASIAGRLAAPGMAVYAATKHAVVAYSASCRRELAPYNVRVFCVEPGFTETPMVTTTLHPAGPDLSRTRLTKTFRRAASEMGKTIGRVQSVDLVSTAIAACLFSNSRASMPPHIVIDETKFWVYVIGSILPHAWVDRVVAFAMLE